jgi:ketosteroid isomerase-like protein
MAESRNVALVRELIEAWNAGDRERWVPDLDPEVEIRTIRARLETRPYRGVEGFRKALADFDEDWEQVNFEVQDVRGTGSDELVVATTQMTSRGRASGVELEVPLALLWEFRDGLIVRVESFSDPAEALREAGIDA